MSVKTIIEEAKKLSKEEKQQIAYYFLVSTLNEDKRNDLMQLFIHSFDLDIHEVIGKESINKKQRKLGFLQDVEYYIADDFDAPLDDLKEYM